MLHGVKLEKIEEEALRIKTEVRLESARLEERLERKIEVEANRVLRELRATNGVLVIKAEMALEKTMEEIRKIFTRRLYTSEVEMATARMEAHRWDSTVDEVFRSESSAMEDKIDDLEGNLLSLRATLESINIL